MSTANKLVRSLIGFLALTLITLAASMIKEGGSVWGFHAVGKPAASGYLVGHSIMNTTSPPLRELQPIVEQQDSPYDSENKSYSNWRNEGIVLTQFAPVVQRAFGPLAMPSPILNWDGISYPGSGQRAPDTNGEAGVNYYVQVVNFSFQIWTKSGSPVYGPASISTLWTGTTSPCLTTGLIKDPVVLYDQLADRWWISGHVSVQSTYSLCIAISQTNDPTGSWYVYTFSPGTIVDYSKPSVWPDGYYMSYLLTNNIYIPLVFNRAQLLSKGTLKTDRTKKPLAEV